MSVLNETLGTVATSLSNFTFNTTDYVVFVLMLSISAAIGAYFGFFAKGADTTDEFLMGGKHMKTIPIAISLVASQLSALSIMTIPSEMYTYGINYVYNVGAMLLVIPVLIWVVIPVFYNNSISNCYEYLEMRFNRQTRELQTYTFLGIMAFILPVFMFTPSLAFSQVTGINIHVINSIVCSICIFYTMVGGIKAVVWTDVIQATIMVISVVLVGVLGTVKVGGLSEVFRIAGEGKRLESSFVFDATTRATFWNSSITSLLMWISYVGMNQSCVQRIVSLPSLAQAKKSLIIFGVGFLLIMGLNCYTGIAMYARFAGCDPLSTGHVTKLDKMVPYFVQDVAGHLKGMPGVFISCVFSAALSTISANLNALSGVLYFDYIKPRINHTEHKANLIMKLTVLLAGIYCVVGGVVVQNFTSILQITYSIGGVCFGSGFGVFLLGMLMPRAHGRAAFWGNIGSIAIMAIIVAGAQGRLNYEQLPRSTETCAATDFTKITTNSSAFTIPLVIKDYQSYNIFDISFNWYAPLGALIFFILAIPLSFILEPEKTQTFDPKLLSPVVQRFIRREYQPTHVEDLSEVKVAKVEKAMS